MKNNTKVQPRKSFPVYGNRLENKELLERKELGKKKAYIRLMSMHDKNN